MTRMQQEMEKIEQECAEAKAIQKQLEKDIRKSKRYAPIDLCFIRYDCYFLSYYIICCYYNWCFDATVFKTRFSKMQKRIRRDVEISVAV